MTSRFRASALLFALVLAGCASAPAPVATGDPTAASTATPATTSQPTPRPSPSAAPSPTQPAVLAADLDGVLVDPAIAHRLPLAVSIDDARAARPQSGFNAASIVYQAPADGYESRYLMVFQEGDATDIGPVRSARIYLTQWASEVHGALAHYGGDRQSRKWIAAYRGTLLTDVDGIGPGNPAFHRISTRTAPHNAYTTTDDLRRVAESFGASATMDPTLHVRPFRDDSAPADRGTSQTLSIPYRTVTVGYAYDPATNAYLRSLDGAAHIDAMDGRQVTARTVVVLWMDFRTDNTIEPGHNRPVLSYIGTGPLTIYAEGRAIQGTWSKSGQSAATYFLDASGREIPLVRGRIFVQVVPTGTKVTAK